METLVFLILIGLVLGFLLGWMAPSPLDWSARRRLRADNRALREHLSTKMEIDASGLEQLKRENAHLKHIAENLRATNATLRTKPGRAELRLLHVYDQALTITFARAPGFAPFWQGVIVEVERGMLETDHGMRAFVKKVFRPTAHLERFPGEEDQG